MNKYKYTGFGIFLALIISTSAVAQYKPLHNAQELKQKLDEMAGSTHSIDAEFKQEKYLDILSNTIKSEGEIIFKKPNLLKWAYQHPYEYIIVLDGKAIKIKDEEKTNTFDIASSKVFKQVNDLIVSSVNGQILQEDKFDIQYFENSGNYIAFMEPKAAQMKNFITKIEIFFDKTDLTVNKIVMHEPNADYTKIQFINKKINSNVPDEAFNIN